MFQSLTSLQIIDCENFKRLPDELGNLECLEVLTVEGTAIREVPKSLGQLYSLGSLVLSNNKLERTPEILHQLSSLVRLELSESNLERIPEFLRSLPSRTVSRLTSLNLSVDLRNCLKLDPPNELSEIFKDEWIKQSFHGEIGITKSMYFPGNEIPKWFRHQNRGSKLTLKTPPIRSAGYNRLVGFALCAVVESDPVPKCFWHQSLEDVLCDVRCDWKTAPEGYWWYSRFLGRISYVESDHVFLGSYLLDGRFSYVNNISFHVYTSDGRGLEYLKVKEYGIHFVYGQDSTESTKEEEEEPFPKRLKYSSTPSQLILFGQKLIPIDLVFVLFSYMRFSLRSFM